MFAPLVLGKMVFVFRVSVFFYMPRMTSASVHGWRYESRVGALVYRVLHTLM